MQINRSIVFILVPVPKAYSKANYFDNIKLTIHWISQMCMLCVSNQQQSSSTSWLEQYNWQNNKFSYTRNRTLKLHYISPTRNHSITQHSFQTNRNSINSVLCVTKLVSVKLNISNQRTLIPKRTQLHKESNS